MSTSKVTLESLVQNPLNPNDKPYRTKYQLHPNERFRRFGTWDKL